MAWNQDFWFLAIINKAILAIATTVLALIIFIFVIIVTAIMDPNVLDF